MDLSLGLSCDEGDDKERKEEERKQEGRQMCAVCGDDATGIHYRVMTCEGCKGFWRRTIQKEMGDKYVCKVWTQKCEVNPETRGRCQRCRYLACVRVGMVADLVMGEGERMKKRGLVEYNRIKKRQKMEHLRGEKEDEIEKKDEEFFQIVETLHGDNLGHIMK